MKLQIYSHCTMDTINIGGASVQRSGGAACYSGIMARRLKFDVDLVTKFGGDFEPDILEQNGIRFEGALSGTATTRFVLDITGQTRRISIANSCEPLKYAESDADGVLVSPLFCEVAPDTFETIKKNADFTFLDPQGFLRSKDANGAISLERTDVDLSGVSAIKAGADELAALTGDTGITGMKILRERGVKYVLHTDGKNVHLLEGDNMYSLVLPNKKIRDTTGVGDIFSSAFACTILKERDSLWGLCFAAGAAQAALDSAALGPEKVPSRGATETNASYFYNTVRFGHA